jgi:hypothetical protein
LFGCCREYCSLNSLNLPFFSSSCLEQVGNDAGVICSSASFIGLGFIDRRVKDEEFRIECSRSLLLLLTSDSVPSDIEFGVISPDTNCNDPLEDDFDEFGVSGYVPLEILIGLVGVVTFIDELSSVLDDNLSFVLLS